MPIAFTVPSFEEMLVLNGHLISPYAESLEAIIKLKLMVDRCGRVTGPPRMGPLPYSCSFGSVNLWLRIEPGEILLWLDWEDVFFLLSTILFCAC